MENEKMENEKNEKRKMKKWKIKKKMQNTKNIQKKYYRQFFSA